MTNAKALHFRNIHGRYFSNVKANIHSKVGERERKFVSHDAVSLHICETNSIMFEFHLFILAFRKRNLIILHRLIYTSYVS